MSRPSKVRPERQNGRSDREDPHPEHDPGCKWHNRKPTEVASLSELESAAMKPPTFGLEREQGPDEEADHLTRRLSEPSYCKGGRQFRWILGLVAEGRAEDCLRASVPDTHERHEEQHQPQPGRHEPPFGLLPDIGALIGLGAWLCGSSSGS